MGILGNGMVRDFVSDAGNLVTNSTINRGTKILKKEVRGGPANTLTKCSCAMSNGRLSPTPSTTIPSLSHHNSRKQGYQSISDLVHHYQPLFFVYQGRRLQEALGFRCLECFVVNSHRRFQQVRKTGEINTENSENLPQFLLRLKARKSVLCVRLVQALTESSTAFYAESALEVVAVV